MAFAPYTTPNVTPSAVLPVFPFRPADLWAFGWQQALSCLFPGLLFVTLALSRVLSLPNFLPRYDFILIACLLIQGMMYTVRLETADEMKVIALFHLIGLALELYKTHMGSWSYREASWTRIGGVPLYSGFMYASVASYLCQAWRRLEVDLENWPGTAWTLPLAMLVYANFFTHHFIPDIRWVLIGLIFLVFYRGRVTYTVRKRRYRLPLVLAFALIGFFIWIAENIATFFGAWQYPDQQTAWRLVHASKMSSWFLLCIISFIIVAQLEYVKAGRQSRPHQRTG